MPLLCSGRRFKVERAHQVESGRAQVETVERGPQIDHVSFLLTARVETVEHVRAQVHAEGAATSVGAVDGTGATLLHAGATQLGGEAEVFEHARQR